MQFTISFNPNIYTNKTKSVYNSLKNNHLIFFLYFLFDFLIQIILV